MKKMIATISTVWVILLSFGSSPLQNITFEWQYTDTNIVDAFYIHYSPDLNTPLTNWPVLAVAPATQSSYTNYVVNTNFTVPILPGAYFFYVTASNFWGESMPSNSTNVPGPTLMPVMKIPHK